MKTRDGRDGSGLLLRGAAGALGLLVLGWCALGCDRDVRLSGPGDDVARVGGGGVGPSSASAQASTSSSSTPTSSASSSSTTSSSSGGGDPWEDATGSDFTCERHTATAIGEGRVLLVGACYPSLYQAPAPAFVYDLATHSFSAVFPLEGRSFHAAVRLPDGRVALAGESPHVEYFDPETETFTLGPLLSVPRYEPTLIALPDGRVRVMGGQAVSGEALASTELVDADAESSTPGPSLLEPRYRSAALPLPGGGVWILGGDFLDLDAWSTEALATTERSDCGACAFTSAPPLAGLAGELSATFGGGEGVVVGTYALAWRDGAAFGPAIDHATEILGPAVAYTPTGRFVAAGTAIWQSQTRVVEATPGGAAHLVAAREGSGFTSLTPLGGDALLVVSGRAAIVHLP